MSVKLENVTVEMPLLDLHLCHALEEDDKSRGPQVANKPTPTEIANRAVQNIRELKVGGSYYATIMDGQGAKITKASDAQWTLCYQAGALMTTLALSDKQLNQILDASTHSISEAEKAGDLVDYFKMTHDPLPHWLLDGIHLSTREKQHTTVAFLISHFRIPKQTFESWTHFSYPYPDVAFA